MGSRVHDGGYEYEFVDKVSPSQKCSICLLPMRDAVQTENCGHRFCRICFERIVSRGNAVCPTGRCQITGPRGFYNDVAFARDILCLRVKCKQEKMGCDWTGQVANAEQHQTECPYEKESCDACGEKVQRRLQKTHMKTECPQRIVECIYCEDKFPFSSKKDHNEKYCKRFPLSCTNNCGQKIPRELEGEARFLICTDVAARVVNVTFPDDKQNYVHRIGGVGRAERMGLAISVISDVKEKVWYHSCPSRGKSCYNTRIRGGVLFGTTRNRFNVRNAYCGTGAVCPRARGNGVQSSNFLPQSTTQRLVKTLKKLLEL